MIKSRLHRALETHLSRLRSLAQARREVSPSDPAADALDYAAGSEEELLRRTLEPTVMLSADEWGAEQEPPVVGKTVRRWCRAGELEHEVTPGGIRIPLGAERVRRDDGDDGHHEIPIADAPEADEPPVLRAPLQRVG